MTLSEIVGENVTRLMEERGWRNGALSRATGINPGTTSLIHRGKIGRLSLVTVMLVAKGFGVPVDVVLAGAENADEMLDPSGSERAASTAQPSADTMDIRGELAETNERLARLALAVEKALGRPLEGESQQRTIRRQSPGTPARLRPRSL